MTHVSAASTKNNPSFLTGTTPTWLSDVIASLVGFLVAIPMSLGIAIASGVPAALGIVGALVGSFVVTPLTSAPLMVTGPAAGLVAITFDTVNRVGLENIGIIVVLAGLFQILSGFFKIGQLFRAITPSVIHGMMAGIGLIIIFSQFHIMFDIKPTGSALQNMLHIPKTIQLFLSNPSGFNAGTISLLAILTLVLFRFLPKPFKEIPSSCYAIAVGIFAANYLQFNAIHYISLPENLFESLHFIKPVSFSLILNPQVITAAVALAFISNSKALLTASATESMHSAERTVNNKEVMVQGLGNVICGLIGSIPITGEVLRSTVNIHTGAKTRWAMVMIGVWLTVFVAVFPQFLELIPISCLAGLLVYTGFQLLGLNHLKELAQLGNMEVAIFVITALGVTFIDPLDGVIIGMIMGLVSLCLKLSSLVVELDDEIVENVQVVTLQGKGTFVNVPKLASTLEKLHPGKNVRIDIGSLDFVDNAFSEYIHSWHKGYSVTGGQIQMDWESLDDLLHNDKPAVDDVESTENSRVLFPKTEPNLTAP